MDIKSDLKRIPKEWKIQTIEMHTGGEPLRIFTSGIPDPEGDTILEKRKYFREHYDFLRKTTMWEPRGHADMYGAVLTKPVTPDGHFGVFFMHNEGYSTMCGHAIIALTKFAVETGWVTTEGSDPEIRIDTPPGRVTATAHIKNDKVIQVSFKNVPSFVLLSDAEIKVRGIGRVRFDVAFGGAFYAFCNAKDLGLDMDATDYGKLIDYGREIKKAVSQNFSIRHPFEEELSFLYGVIFTGDSYDFKHHSRNVCIFADGEVDRSATGTGVSARAAIHFSRGELKKGQSITIESILGTTMEVRITEVFNFDVYKAVIPEVTGQAWFTGRNELWMDPGDPLKEGFLFR